MSRTAGKAIKNPDSKHPVHGVHEAKLSAKMYRGPLVGAAARYESHPPAANSGSAAESPAPRIETMSRENPNGTTPLFRL